MRGAAAAILRALALALAMSTGSVLAIEPSAAVRADDDAPAVEARARWERPAEGTLARGVLGVPAWVVAAVGGSIVLCAAGALVLSARRARVHRRGARGPRGAP